MNRIYRVVFNRSRGLHQVTSELSRSHGAGTRAVSAVATAIANVLARSRLPAPAPIAAVEAQSATAVATAAPGRFAKVAAVLLPAITSLGIMLPGSVRAGVSITDTTSGFDLALYGPNNPFTIGSSVSVYGPNVGIYGGMTHAYTLINSGTISGFSAAISLPVVGSISNDGTISATQPAGIGISLDTGGRITNDATGIIEGDYRGIAVGYGVVTIVNSGTIRSTATSNYQHAIRIEGGGTITNTATGTISGLFGIHAVNAPATVVNYGTVSGVFDPGVFLRQGGKLTNHAGASILGHAQAAYIYNGQLLNDGTIASTGQIGVMTVFGGTITNTGTIKGLYSGISVYNPGSLTITNTGLIESTNSQGVGGAVFASSGDPTITLTNSGTIRSVGTNAVTFSTGNDVLNIVPGAVFNGNVLGGSGSNTLALAAHTLSNTGTISGIGTQFQSFGTVKVDAGADWVLQGTNTVGSSELSSAGHSLANTGTFTGIIELQSAAGSLSNSGSIIGTNAAVQALAGFAGTVSNTGTISSTSNAAIQIGIGGGVVTNDATGRISGGVTGIALSGNGSTIVNSGTIAGPTASVEIIGNNNVLELRTGASLNGDATAAGTGNTLRLDGSGSIGLGQISGFSNIETTTGTVRTLANNVTAGGTLNVITAADSLLSMSAAIGLAGEDLHKSGIGTFIIDGTALAGTAVDVIGGSLIVGSDIAHASAQLQAGTVTVESGARLGGHGAISGEVAVLGGGSLAPGHSIGILEVDGNLSLAQGSRLDFEFGAPASAYGAPGAGDSVTVSGDLTLDGAVLDITDVGNMGPGLYSLFSYGGALTVNNGGLSVGSTPSGSYAIQYLTADKQINLLDLAGDSDSLSFWNANGGAGPTQSGGGSGTWLATTNFSGAAGAVAGPISAGFAIFGGAPGTVTVDDSAGAVSAGGLQFTTDGYVMDGDALTLIGSGSTAPIVRVGDGSAAGASWVTTLGNPIAGSDGLEKTDLGTLVLTGNNTFTGGVTVSGGMLSVASDANLGAGGNVLTLNGGALRITSSAFQSTARSIVLGGGGGTVDIADAANSFTVSQPVTGAGALVKSGNGTLVMTGNNGFTGATTIAAGTLALTDLGSIASSSELINNGVFDIGGTTNGASITSLSGAGNVALGAKALTLTSAAGTVGGVISGDGKLIIASGHETLNGINTYTGGTDLQSGTLTLGNSSAVGTGTFAMANGTTAVFTGSFTLANHITLSDDPNFDVALGQTNELSGGISDGTAPGDLVKTGGGLLRLSGVNTYTGPSEVAAGTLEIVGSAMSVFTVNSGATLTGAGSVGGLRALSGSKITPGGAALGTLTVNGNVTFESGAHLEVDITDSGANDRLHATGTATLNGGSVVATAAGTNWSDSTKYTLLTADGGVSGTFDNLTSNMAFLTSSLSYDADNVYLTLSRNSEGFASVGVTPNQRATAAAIQAAGSKSTLYQRIVTLDATQAQTSFENLSGAGLASTRTAIISDSRFVRDAIGGHLQGFDSQSQSDEKGSLWASYGGRWADYDGTANTGSQSSNSTGLLIGADRNLDVSAARVGAVFAHTDLSNDGAAIGGGSTSGNRNDAHSIANHFALYAAADLNAWRLQAGAARSWYRTKSHRTIDVPGLQDRTSADYDSNVTQAYVDGGYAFTLKRATLTPFADLARIWTHQDRIQEQGSAAALDVESNGSGVNYTTAGLRTDFAATESLNLYARAGYQHAWGDVSASSSQRFSNGTTSFDIEGVPLAKNAGVADLGLRYKLNTARRNISLDATYRGQFGDQVKDQSARMAISMTF